MKPKESSLTHKRLREVLNYDPLTGIFTWCGSKPGSQGRTVAGSTSGTYVRITVDDVSYRAHRLAWFWMTGSWPKEFMDHVDLNKHNNAWSNLREATKSQNHANRPALSTNKSGIKGAYFDPVRRDWQSAIRKDGKTVALGHFRTANEAHAAYCSAAKKLFGEFARAV